MATLILGAAGAAIGGSIGGAILGVSAATIGGFIGSTIGSVVDSWIISSLAPTQRIEGARLDTLRITSATEGAVIPRLYGRMRMGGNIIWATDFREETKTTTQGGGKGGGGGKVKTTEYLYYASFAVALCEGPITGIGRIWADGKPMDLSGVTWRWYPGDEAQTADPFIAAKMGAASTPAYRGTAYVVFEELALSTYGNRLPQLSFEVFRPLADPDTAEGLTRAVTMIPASGEFTYATQAIRKTDGGATVPENLNALADSTDMVEALDRLQAMAPAVESVSLVVAWFGDDLRAGSCKVRPGVEVSAKSTTPASWSVNGVSRASAFLVSRDDQDRPVYGGTPSDFAVVQAIQEMKARGLRVTFYPFILMDVPPGNTPAEPVFRQRRRDGPARIPLAGADHLFAGGGVRRDRGQDRHGRQRRSRRCSARRRPRASASRASRFRWTGTPGDWGLRRMVLHYAHLCAAAGGVDAFLIGTEMPGLTTIRSGASHLSGGAGLSGPARGCALDPRVRDEDRLCGRLVGVFRAPAGRRLAATCSSTSIRSGPIRRSISSGSTTTCRCRTGATGSSMPTRPRAGPRSTTGPTCRGTSRAAKASTGSMPARPTAPRRSAPRSPMARPASRGSSATRICAPGGRTRTTTARAGWRAGRRRHGRRSPSRSGSPSSAVPAIDRGTNQPNVFFDPKSSESFTPHFSRGWRDDAIQRAYLEATYLWWGEAANNPVSSVYGGRMVHVPECAAWTWDARPYPFFPALTDVWTDGANWRLGHWLTGRLGAVSLAALVRHLCLRAGLPESRIDVTGLWGAVEGYAITALESPRASITTLSRHFGFDAVETEGVIRFVMRGRASVATLAPDDLVAAREGDVLELTRGQETELPQALKWQVARADEDYDAALVEARRITVDTTRIASESFPMAVPPEEAERRCRRALMEAWVGRETAAFRLPPSRLALDPADAIRLAHDGRLVDLRLVSIADAEARGIEAVRQDRATYDLPPGDPRAASLTRAVVFGAPDAVLMDLPQLTEDQPAHRPLVAAHAVPWPGEMAVFRSPSTDGFELLTTFGSRARIGTLVSDFYAGPTSRFDLGNALVVDLLTGTLESVTDLTLFGGANALAIESAPGVWEIVQAGAAELLAPGRYRLTRLLRGQRGTEGAMGNPAPAGARVVVLDTALASLPIAEADLGLPWNWRIGPASRPVSDETYVAQAFTPAGVGLRPFSVAHVEQPWRTPRAPGDLTIRWTRRSRALAADSWGGLEVPLGEELEAYEVEILDGATVKRVLSTATTSAVYTAAQQTADWGAPLGPGDTLDIRIFQLSALVGRGAPKTVTLTF